MKVINVPYSKEVQSYVDTLAMALAVFGFYLAFIAVFALDWKAFLIGVAITLPISIYVWKTMTGQIVVLGNNYINIRLVNDINDSGFTLVHNQKKRRIQWKNVSSIHLINNKVLLVRLKNFKEIKIENNYGRWYALLKEISNSNIERRGVDEFLKKTFNNLFTCKVCGMVALNKEKCLSCRSSRFNIKLEQEFENEIEYIKSEQLELFCTVEEDEKVDFYEEQNDGFVRDKNWKPMVSKEEVKEFSKAHYW